MKRYLSLLLLVAASTALGYEGTSFQAFIEVGYPKILLSRENAAETSGCLWFSGARLDGRWKPLSFVFVPKSDGTACLRFGPTGEGDIPFYYDDIRVNNVPLEAKSWVFNPPAKEGGLIGSLVAGTNGESCLVLYGNAHYFIKVKKGQRTEVTMRAKSGSVLDAFINRLSGVTANIGEAMKTGSALRGSALESGRELAGNLNALLALSDSKVHVSVPRLASDGVSLETLKAKTIELAKAYEAEKSRTAAAELPCLYDQPEIRMEIRTAIVRAAQISAQLKTSCLLEFMLKH